MNARHAIQDAHGPIGHGYRPAPASNDDVCAAYFFGGSLVAFAIVGLILGGAHVIGWLLG